MIQLIPKGFKKHSRLIMQFWVFICVCLHTGKGVNVYMSFCRWLFSLMLLAWTPTACYILCIVCYDDLFQSAFRLEILHWGRNLCGGRSYLNKISSFPTRSNKLSLQMQGSKHDVDQLTCSVFSCLVNMRVSHTFAACMSLLAIPASYFVKFFPYERLVNFYILITTDVRCLFFCIHIFSILHKHYDVVSR